MKLEPRRNIYVGHRYVPKIFGEWSKENTYEGLSIVTFEGASYTSKKHVPVGIDIKNEEYWVLTGNYNAQIEYYRKETERVNLDNQTQNDKLNDIVEDVTAIDENINNIKEDMYTYTSINHDIYVNGTSLNNGDGTEALPFNNFSKAIKHIKSLSDKAVEGKWTIHVSGIITEGHKIFDMPNLREPLNIIGEVDNLGNPTTLFDGENASLKFGLWIEPADNLVVNVENIIFKDYGNDGTGDTDTQIGYGILMKDKGFLKVKNCHFINNYIGIGGINQNRTTVAKCYFENNYTGVMTQYNSTLTVGSTNNSQNTWNTFKNNSYGVIITRNSVAHVDYNEINGSIYSAIKIDMASRCNVYGNNILNNKIGVLLQGASEWIDNYNNYTNNEVNYQHYGVSRETRIHSGYTNVFYDYMPFVPSPNEVSLKNTSETLLGIIPSSTKLNAEQVTGLGKRVKVKIVGKMSKGNTESVRLTVKLVNTEDASESENLGYIDFDGSATFEAFEYTLESVNTDINKQVVTNKLVRTNSNTKLNSGIWNKKFTKDKTVRIYATASTGTATVTIDYVQISVAG